MNKTILFILLSVFLASNMQAQKRHTADRTRVAKEQAPVAPAKKAEAVSPKKKSQVRSTTAVAKKKKKSHCGGTDNHALCYIPNAGCVRRRWRKKGVLCFVGKVMVYFDLA